MFADLQRYWLVPGLFNVLFGVRTQRLPPNDELIYSTYSKTYSETDQALARQSHASKQAKCGQANGKRAERSEPRTSGSPGFKYSFLSKCNFSTTRRARHLAQRRGVRHGAPVRAHVPGVRAARHGRRAHEVGAVKGHPWLESAWFQPLRL